MSKKITKEEAIKILNDNGYELLSDEYTNSQTRIYIMDLNGYKFETCINSFNRNIKQNISFRIVDSKNPFSIDNIKLWLKLNNKPFILLSDKYIGNGSKNKNDKLTFMCIDNNHIFDMTWNDMHNSKVCPKCYHRYSNEEEFLKCVKDTYGDEYTILGRYINSQTKILVKHNICNNEFEIKPNHFLQNHGCNNKLCCHASGKNHYRWNPNLTYEDRTKERKSEKGYIDFIKSVLKRDNYYCQCCHTRNNLVVHHKDGYNWCIDRRIDLSNGVTLCDDCHKNFHNVYGYGNNTEIQWNEYICDNKESA